MTDKKLALGKWILAGLLVAAAGIFYCCGNRETDRVTLTKETGETITAESASANGAPAEDPAEEDAAEEASLCYVYVCGEVLDPGVYRLTEGQRVYEAIELAGGFTPEAERNYWNLAQPVTDGMKIEVPDQERAAAMPADAMSTGAAQADSGKVNINTAGRDQLMTLTGIGEARAEAIIAYRTEHGDFQSIEDIMKVSGIKEAAFQKIKEKITV